MNVLVNTVEDKWYGQFDSAKAGVRHTLIESQIESQSALINLCS